MPATQQIHRNYAPEHDRGVDWREYAACATTDPDLWFPDSFTGDGLHQAGAAKAICRGCSVRRSCEAFADATPEKYGVWAGQVRERRPRSRQTTAEKQAA